MDDRSVRLRIGSGIAERERIQSFVRALPDEHIHVLDLPYRLASPAFGSSDVALWETDHRELTAFAVWQPAFKMLDFGMDRRHGIDRLGNLMIDWIDSWFALRTRAGVGAPLASGDTGAPAALTCWLKVGRASGDLVPLLERRGFTRCRWSIVHLERPLGGLGHPDLPPGFSIRQLKGDVEVEAWAKLHRAVFPRVGMSVEWRLGIERSPGYRPELDLVVACAEDTPVAFCHGWVGELGGEQIGEIEPLGTHPDFRRKCLGRAVLQEVMRRMADAGIARVFVEPWDDNVGAVHVYESVGFRPTFRLPAFAKEYT